jgi:hypothetical protein
MRLNITEIALPLGLGPLSIKHDKPKKLKRAKAPIFVETGARHVVEICRREAYY